MYAVVYTEGTGRGEGRNRKRRRKAGSLAHLRVWRVSRDNIPTHHT
jgi:hypothetical protein